MLLFEGEPALFFLFILSVLSLLIGGCLWGSGEDAGDRPKMIGGIALFTIGCATTAIFIALYTYKRIHKKKKRRREIERILQMKDPNTGVRATEQQNGATKNQVYDNRGADLRDGLSTF
ncbi:Glutamate receptor NMDA [Fasciola gigantica]|uniref:Glutamate receptor NMDA n=2 Tax=Fasciola TaxID=6191 RepID=A0A4E0RB03_FASHE|nr:Glutamate receptor NMDA [Fasciola hepatica]TPP67142.1 Glutamate receptor NMDA [Fasciola gigantica]